VALAVLVLRLWHKDLSVPFSYQGDTIAWVTAVKGVHEDGMFGPFRRLSAPFGLDWVDWRIGMPLDLTVMSVLASLSGDAGRALNLYWILSMVATSVAATLCFRRLGVAASAAFTLGILYGFLPFTFFRNVSHIALVYNLVPFILLIALRMMSAPAALTRRFLALALVVCVLQGLSFAYTAFFSAFFIVVATTYGVMHHRRLRPLAFGTMLLACLVLSATLGMLPSFAYRWKHGPNDTLAYKTPAEAEYYGLKIRHLLTPIPDHPLPMFRTVDRLISEAHFPHETENASSRLGTVASVGFLALLALLVLRIPTSPAGDRLTSAATLVGAAILVTTVGGFGALFNVFVSSDIRCYNRIAVFIGFLALLAVGIFLSSLRGRLASSRGRVTFDFFMVVMLLAGIADQASTSGLVPRYGDDAAAFAREEEFVRQVEESLPAGAMVFQLPHTSFPVELETTRMGLYDHGRPFLHSRSLRWSWGAFTGRHGDWHREVARLEPPDFLRQIALAGFSSVWLDRLGYDDEGHRLEEAFQAVTGTMPLRSGDDRWVVFNIDAFRRNIVDSMPRDRYESMQRNILSPVRVSWIAGCYAEERDTKQRWRWCRPAATLGLANDLDEPRTVVLETTLQGLGERRKLRITGALFGDELTLTAVPSTYERRLVLAPHERVTLRLVSDVGAVPVPGDSRELAFVLVNFRVVEAE
jgi:phosphoglycerol transferase